MSDIDVFEYVGLLQGKAWAQYAQRLEEQIAHETKRILKNGWDISDEKDTTKRHEAWLARGTLIWALGVPQRAIEKEQKRKKEEEKDEKD